MPIYEYECEKCGHVFETIQKVDARPIRQCEREQCRGKVQRLVSSPAIQFKGTGWYITDYARKGQKDGDGADSSKSSDSAGKKEKQDKSGAESKKKSAKGSSAKSDPKTKSS